MKDERCEEETRYYFTLSEWDKASEQADKEMKENNGHSFQITLKTRCMYCGRSPKAKGKCRGWFMTLHNNLLRILINK